jgi:acetyl-CoA carboxylase biotin carboxyl carrier protein
MTEPPIDGSDEVAAMPPAPPAEASRAESSLAELPPADAPPVAAETLGSGDASLLSLIDRLSALLDRTELTELEVQVGSTGLVLRKPSALAPSAPVAVQVPSGASPGADAAQAPAPTTADPATFARPAVMAPLSGIWYGSPAPGSAPYVSLGGEVAVGQVIGLIEAMKLFNEIKSDKAGRVVKINAEDGKLVRAKQPLIEVDPL